MGHWSRQHDMCQVKPVVEIMAPGRRPYWTPLHSALLFALLLHGLVLMYLLVMTPAPREEPLQLFDVTVAQAVAPLMATPEPKPTQAPDIPLPALRNTDPALPPGPAPKAADMPLNDQPPAPLKLDQTSYPRRVPTGPPNPNLVVTRNKPGAVENGNPMGVTGGKGDQEGSGSGGGGGGGGGQEGTTGNQVPAPAGKPRQDQSGQIQWVQENLFIPLWVQMYPFPPKEDAKNMVYARPDVIADSYDTNRYTSSGVVRLEFRILTDGHVSNIVVKGSSGDPELDQYAVSLARESTWFPCTLHEQKLWGIYTYRIHFY